MYIHEGQRIRGHAAPTVSSAARGGAPRDQSGRARLRRRKTRSLAPRGGRPTRAHPSGRPRRSGAPARQHNAPARSSIRRRVVIVARRRRSHRRQTRRTGCRACGTSIESSDQGKWLGRSEPGPRSQASGRYTVHLRYETSPKACQPAVELACIISCVLNQRSWLPTQRTLRRSAGG